MALAPEDLPEPDRIEGAPHPREAARLFGQSHAEADFLDAFRADRLHSAWLLTGPRGVGKATLAWKLAAFLLAQPAPGGLFAAPPPDTLALPEGNTDARLVHAGAHPRLHVLRRGPTEKGDRLSQTIAVERVRGLKSFFHLSAADGGRRVVIVDSVDEMGPAAANALLKELEEPPALATLLLVSHRPAGLLPTIRSRCRELRCAALSPADLRAALEQAGHTAAEADALGALAAGSVGDAIRLIEGDGLTLYRDLVGLLAGLPRLDRPAAIRLADSCAGRGTDGRFALAVTLMDLALARLARTGVLGPPALEAADGEAALFARLSPDAGAARAWAVAQQDLGARAERGRAVNLDPAALILDMIFRIEETAQSVAAA
ncbi:MAG: DNA polymerase III subunit delta' [Limimaricola sp.]|uniref:DNA polymerase III subunit delta' n=1 Tax=Limimaricola sp. TaxID=2211665 RepID=UPI001D33E5C7|nr:DNA polymerase III subunit delta' [Limimaricola sp.]MBI1416197.1 DNA polymerase III subunit delta' [Limimaricola sp.]